MLTRKCIAVGSGKGGVGKSTTAINISLMLAKHHMQVAIVDRDPLSNIITILDIDGNTEAYSNERLRDPQFTLDKATLRPFAGCDILFPYTKDVQHSAHLIKDLIFKRFATSINARYDLVLFDLPAGINSEQNYQFLPHISHLVVVVQPEPTSHVSSGGYVKAALQIAPKLSVHFWHNRFEIKSPSNFHFDDVIRNYQKFADKTMWLSPKERTRCANISYVPRDDILDLLNVAVRPLQSILYKCRGLMQMLCEGFMRHHVHCPPCNERQHQQLHYFLNNLYPLDKLRVDNAHTIVKELYSHWNRFYALSSSIATADRLKKAHRSAISNAIDQLISLEIFRQIIRARGFLNELIDRIALRPQNYDRQLQLYEQAIKAVLTHQNTAEDRAILDALSLLFTYAALTKIIRPESVQRVIFSYIPLRQEGRKRIRDRRQQIAHLVAHNRELHRSHLEMVRKFYPLFMRQLEQLSAHYATAHYIFRAGDKSVNRAIYVRILSHAIHEIVYSGLGVVVGLPLSSSYQAIRVGSLKLMRKIGESST